MKQTVTLAGEVQQLFGTHDENLKILEDGLSVTTRLVDDRLEIEGDAPQPFRRMLAPFP